MKHWIASLAAVTVLLPLTFAPLILAHGGEENVIVLKVAGSGLETLDDADLDMVKIDISELEVGESRVEWTDSGKEIVVTRTEDGHTITLDGEELDLPQVGEHLAWTVDGGEALPLGHHGAIAISGADAKVFAVEADGVVHLDGEEGATPQIRMLRVGSPDVGESLLASGVLDDLDDETRDRILDELAAIAGDAPARHVVVRKVTVDDDEE